ncbi:MAG: helix-turn-helix transcriptional regulator [Prevotella sp.]|nr:helix-turn-helix transcriptional regulator [Prevotella sp.]
MESTNRHTGGESQYERLERLLAANRNLTKADQQFLDAVHRIVLELMPLQCVDIENVSSRLFIHSSKFRRCVVSATGVSPANYLMVLRMRHALEILEYYPNNTISMVATACGFANHSHFTHVFKRMLGCAPQQYLREKGILS